MDDNFKRKLEMIGKKLEDNPELKDELNKAMEKIENIFEAPIEINIINNEEFENYANIFDQYDENDLETDENQVITLKTFLEMFNDETEYDFDFYIDPIYLKRGINPITNILITSVEENKLIIVPKPVEENE